MRIELRGVEFVNKGAELMLHAVVNKLREVYPNAQIVMHQGSRTPKDKLRGLGIYSKVQESSSVVKRLIKRLIPSILYQLRGWVKESEIDIVIDASGFAFGDQWGVEHAQKRLGDQIVGWKKQNKKIILLPQAFGSFEDDKLRLVMERIINNADLIIAREKVSFNYLTQLSNSEKIKQYPDFTNAIEGKAPDYFDQNVNVAVIPNYKILEQTSANENEYYEFLRDAIIYCRSHRLKPVFLIHEGQRDIEIAKKVNRLFEDPVSIIVESDPLKIKGIIKQMKFVICARFHGVVSALSQGIPSIVTGWSHKYELLLEDYQCEKFLIKSLKDTKHLYRLIDEITDDNTSDSIKKHLNIMATKQKLLTAEMWNVVVKAIEK